jgi:hypothetical protein
MESSCYDEKCDIVLDVLEVAQGSTIASSGWKLDSGATQHICNSTQAYSSFLSYGVPRVLQVGKAAVFLRALGEGTILLQVPSRPSPCGGEVADLTLSKVWYCPDCPFNLISVRRLVETGCTVELSNSGAAVKDQHGRLAAWLAMDQSGLYSCLQMGESAGLPAGAAGVAGAVDHVPEVGGTEHLPPGMGMCPIFVCK